MGHRCGSDPAMGSPVAAFPIQPLGWELSCASGSALISKKKKSERERKKIRIGHSCGQIQILAHELPYATGTSIKEKKII